MNRLHVLVLLAAMACTGLVMGTVKAEAADSGKELRAAVNATAPPFAFMENGKLVGFEVDLHAEVAKRMGKQLVMTNIPFAGLAPGLQAKKWDAAGNTWINKERLVMMDFSDPWVDAQLAFVTRKNDAITSPEQLKGKTVGIVGAGAIGQNPARLCKAFGCRVIAYNHRPKQVEEGLLEFVDLDTLTREADIISLNCPLNDSTRGMFGKERIAMMKKNAILINVARGPVVDSQALADALNEGRIGGAGIDVFEIEPPLDPAHPLLHTPNTIVTPHVAFATQESMALRAEIVFDSLDKFLAGNQINVIL